MALLVNQLLKPAECQGHRLLNVPKGRVEALRRIYRLILAVTLQPLLVLSKVELEVPEG